MGLPSLESVVERAEIRRDHRRGHHTPTARIQVVCTRVVQQRWHQPTHRRHHRANAGRHDSDRRVQRLANRRHVDAGQHNRGDNERHPHLNETGHPTAVAIARHLSSLSGTGVDDPDLQLHSRLRLSSEWMLVDIRVTKYSDVSDTYAVVLLTPESAVKQKTILILGLTIGLTCLCCLLGLASSVVMSLVFTRPLRAIASDMQAIADLDFVNHSDKRESAYAVESSPSQTRQSRSVLSEIDAMGDSFARMRFCLRKVMSYVPASVMETLSAGNDSVLQQHRRNVTVLFLDVVGFTAMTRHVDNVQMIKTLEDCFGLFVELIMYFGGTIDKFIGDCIMAFWNDPYSVDNHETKAVMCALVMANSLKLLQEKWAEADRVPVMVKFGLSAGEVTAGNIGARAREDSEQLLANALHFFSSSGDLARISTASKRPGSKPKAQLDNNDRFNYTVIGPCVNVAARIEALNRYFGTVVLISDDLYRVVKDAIICRRIRSVIVRGYTNAFDVYQPLCTNDQLDLNGNLMAMIQSYEAALKMFEDHKKIPKVMFLMASHLGLNRSRDESVVAWPDDSPACVLLGECENIMREHAMRVDADTRRGGDTLDSLISFCRRNGKMPEGWKMDSLHSVTTNVLVLKDK